MGIFQGGRLTTTLKHTLKSSNVVPENKTINIIYERQKLTNRDNLSPSVITVFTTRGAAITGQPAEKPGYGRCDEIEFGTNGP